VHRIKKQKAHHICVSAVMVLGLTISFAFLCTEIAHYDFAKLS